MAVGDIEADAVPPEDVRWLLEEPPIPERGITIFVGYRGALKTTLDFWLAREVTVAGKNVGIYPQGENDYRSVVRPGLEPAGADLKRVFLPREEEEDEEGKP